MPFKYVIKWRKANPEKVSVEAYNKYPQTKEEKTKPLFTIGKAEGGGLIAIRHLLERAAQKTPPKNAATSPAYFYQKPTQSHTKRSTASDSQ